MADKENLDNKKADASGTDSGSIRLDNASAHADLGGGVVDPKLNDSSEAFSDKNSKIEKLDNDLAGLQDDIDNIKKDINYMKNKDKNKHTKKEIPELFSIDSIGNNTTDGLSNIEKKTGLESSLLEDPDSVVIKPVQEYYDEYYPRYIKEARFRDNVHKTLNLGSFKKLGLSFSKSLSKKSYQKKAGNIVKQYADHVVKDLQDYKLALEIKWEEQELKKAEEEASIIQKKYNNLLAEKSAAERELKKLKEEKENIMKDINSKYEKNIQILESDKKKKITNLEKKLDVDAIVEENVKKIITTNNILKKNDDGSLKYDESILEKKLEDVCLKEVIEGMEKEGNFGFMSKLKFTYSSFADRWDVIEDISELTNIDLVKSIIYSRSKGYMYPVYPFLVTGKPGQQKEKVRGSITSGICTDVSTSMLGNYRFEMAQKTSLALRSVMRKLNPLNETYLSYFSSTFSEVSSIGLYREVKPDGNTMMHYAIDWFIDKLKDAGPSIAILITDGAPSDIPETFASAARLKQFPNIHLRIYLIDGNYETRETVKKIGSAAGPLTKFVPVASKDLGGSAIKDLNGAIGELSYTNTL